MAGSDDKKTYAEQLAEGTQEGGSAQAQRIANFLGNLFHRASNPPPAQPEQESAPQTCPNCGHTLGNEIGYPDSQ